jgi:hypothetical protein
MLLSLEPRQLVLHQALALLPLLQHSAHIIPPRSLTLPLVLR